MLARAAAHDVLHSMMLDIAESHPTRWPLIGIASSRRVDVLNVHPLPCCLIATVALPANGRCDAYYLVVGCVWIIQNSEFNSI